MREGEKAEGCLKVRRGRGEGGGEGGRLSQGEEEEGEGGRLSQGEEGEG